MLNGWNVIVAPDRTCLFVPLFQFHHSISYYAIIIYHSHDIVTPVA
jgi:hypothetical protein